MDKALFSGLEAGRSFTLRIVARDAAGNYSKYSNTVTFTLSRDTTPPTKPAVSVNGVFAHDGERLLRLVTCGGEFEKKVRSYRSNVVVTAIPA